MGQDAQFSPPPGIPARLKSLIDAATTSIDVCMYHFTEPTLASAMIDAVTRGVLCRVILDYNAAYELNSMSWTLSKGGVLVYTDNAHSILHAKYSIIDGITITTGSANWSVNADGAAGEDLVILTAPPSFNSLYQNNWLFHRSHSVPLPR